MIDGEMINKGTTNKEVCSLVFESKHVICTLLYTVQGDPPGTTTCLTTYNYRYECTSSGGGGGDYDYGGGGHPDDPDGLPRTGGTPPIIPEPEVNDIKIGIDSANLDDCLKNVLDSIQGHQHGV